MLIDMLCSDVVESVLLKLDIGVTPLIDPFSGVLRGVIEENPPPLAPSAESGVVISDCLERSFDRLPWGAKIPPAEGALEDSGEMKSE